MSLLTIWCAILGSPYIFSVDIEADKTVYQLKIKIKENSPELKDIAPKTLSLYRIDVDVSDEQQAIRNVETLAPTLTSADIC